MTAVAFRAPTLIAGTPNDDAEAPHVKGQGKFAYLVWHEPPTTTPPGAPQRVHDVFFSRSDNKGQTFSTRTNLSKTPNDNSESEFISASGDRVHVTWLETDNISKNVTVRFRRSGDTGKNFDATRTLSTAASTNVSDLDIAASGDDLHVTWLDGQEVFAVHSGDGGKNVSSPPTNVSNSHNAIGPQVAVVSGHGVVAWRDNDANGNGKAAYAQSK